MPLSTQPSYVGLHFLRKAASMAPMLESQALITWLRELAVLCVTPVVIIKPSMLEPLWSALWEQGEDLESMHE